MGDRDEGAYRAVHRHRITPMTFKNEEERIEALRIMSDLQRNCTSDAQYRVYEQRRQEVLEAKIVKDAK